VSTIKKIQKQKQKKYLKLEKIHRAELYLLEYCSTTI